MPLPTRFRPPPTWTCRRPPRRSGARVAAERVVSPHVFRHTPAFDGPSPGMSSPATELRSSVEPAPRTAIRIRNLSRTFGDLIAIDNLSLDIGQGEFFTIVGPSGCGK